GVVRVDKGRHQLTSALLPGVDPLAAPLCVQLRGYPSKRLLDEGTLVVSLDSVGVVLEVATQSRGRLLAERRRLTRDVLAELEDAALCAVQHLLRHRGAWDAARSIA